MAEELQSLLEKINHDGIQKAEAEREKILAAARAEAEAIRAEAEKAAAAIRAEAEKANAALHEKTLSSLRQARRDILLQLRSELRSRLEAAVGDSTARALSPEFTAGIIRELCAAFAAGPDNEVSVRTAVRDVPALDAALRQALADSLKTAPEILGAKSIASGVEVSFDGGKCYFDFTDEALSGILDSYLGETLAAIFRADR
ncbi:MAG: V-type ATP synthase subunit E family protein [Lentisphaeria bacterium]|nr:V-type ATP synthase subunit E family protein [Lentisphaeria bacterium]